MLLKQIVYARLFSEVRIRRPGKYEFTITLFASESSTLCSTLCNAHTDNVKISHSRAGGGATVPLPFRHLGKTFLILCRCVQLFC